MIPLYFKNLNPCFDLKKKKYSQLKTKLSFLLFIQTEKIITLHLELFCSCVIVLITVNLALFATGHHGRADDSFALCP